MNTYVTGSTIKTLREAQALTQAELAHRLGVTPKAVSKWETGRGLPDISLLQPLARELGVSVIELMRGAPVQNRNRAAHLLRSKLYVCPVCGNILHATGEATVSCCGIRGNLCIAQNVYIRPVPTVQPNIAVRRFFSSDTATLHFLLSNFHLP